MSLTKYNAVIKLIDMKYTYEETYNKVIASLERIEAKIDKGNANRYTQEEVYNKSISKWN